MRDGDGHVRSPTDIAADEQAANPQETRTLPTQDELEQLRRTFDCEDCKRTMNISWMQDLTNDQNFVLNNEIKGAHKTS